MRIAIREQLGLLVLFCSLLALMVLAVATWTQNHAFITDLRLSGLSLTASLKSAQVAAGLLLFKTAVQSISTRLIIQGALRRYIDQGKPYSFLAQFRLSFEQPTHVKLEPEFTHLVNHTSFLQVTTPKRTGIAHGWTWTMPWPPVILIWSFKLSSFPTTIQALAAPMDCSTLQVAFPQAQSSWLRSLAKGMRSF